MTGMEWKDDILQKTYGPKDPWLIDKQEIDDAIFINEIAKDLAHTYGSNPDAIHWDTFCIFYNLALQLQRYFREIHDVNVVDQYVTFTRLCMRQCRTVSCNVVGSQTTGKGKIEEWLDAPGISTIDKLRRVYCLAVGYLHNPRDIEGEFYKKNGGYIL